MGVLVSSAIPANQSVAAEQFRKLSGKQIKSHIIGKQITDDVHWSETYRKGGTIMSVDMGTDSHGSWTIKQDKLCVEKSAVKECYEIWLKGDEVQMRTDGSENLTGFVRAP